MEQLKLSEITFHAMVEATPSAIILVNQEGKIAYANGQAEKLFGYSRTELVSRFVEALIPKRYHQHHPQFRQMFFSTPSSRAMGSGRELYALRKDNTEFPVEIGLNPLVTVDGTMVLVSIIDITMRKKAEERFELVVESAPNAMILVNANGSISLVNHQTEKLFGYDRKELVGGRLEMLIPERFRPKHSGHRNSFFDNPSTRPMGGGRELFGARKDGSEFPVEIGLNPIETPEGLLVLASIIDITERKKHDAAIKARIELEAKNKELEQFNYLASHDLQEPLRTVSNYLQILEEDYIQELSPEINNYLKTIQSATVRMSTLVRALLDFSRLGQNQTLKQVDCNKLVGEVLMDLNSLIQTTAAEINVMTLPVLNINEIEFRQLIQNLLNNAIKFRRTGVTPQIEIGCIKRAESYEFYVKDNGIGIEKKHYDRAFNMFQRLNKTQDFEGYGIGLANCKKIVEMHGGKIWIESEPGQGSTFRFTITNFT